MGLESISFYPDGGFEFLHHDGDLFGATRYRCAERSSRVRRTRTSWDRTNQTNSDLRNELMRFWSGSCGCELSESGGDQEGPELKGGVP
jgi:hypothetical protein